MEEVIKHRIEKTVEGYLMISDGYGHWLPYKPNGIEVELVEEILKLKKKLDNQREDGL